MEVQTIFLILGIGASGYKIIEKSYDKELDFELAILIYVFVVLIAVALGII